MVGAGVEREVAPHPAAVALEEAHQAAVVVHVAVAQRDQVDGGGVEAERTPVVVHALGGEAEVEGDARGLVPARDLDVMGEAVLGAQGRDAARAVGAEAPGDAVVGAERVDGVVDDGGDADPVDGAEGHGGALRAGGAASPP